MPRPARILIYGTDSQLIQTRQWVLEKAGFDVQTVQDLAKAREILSTGTVDTFILCHTLSAEEFNRALSLGHHLQPEMKNLILTAEPFERSHRDATLTAFATPQALITAVSGLVDHVASNV